MLQLVMHDPANYADHPDVSVVVLFYPNHENPLLDKFTGAVVMSVVYDYDVTSHNDGMLNSTERATDLFARVASAEKAALFSAFPFCKCLIVAIEANNITFARDS
jgi:hypothetical protein